MMYFYSFVSETFKITIKPLAAMSSQLSLSLSLSLSFVSLSLSLRLGLLLGQIDSVPHSERMFV